MKKVIIIGSGFAGLSAACFMAKAGWQVTVLEKYATPGGRARQIKVAGFTFDMGPSWYWMPDVFEKFFQKFGKKVADYYHLEKLNPCYRVYWKDDSMDIPDDYAELKNIFEKIEVGSGKRLDKYLKEAEYKYAVGINKLVQKPGRSVAEFFDADLIKGLFKLDVFTSMKEHVGKHFSNSKLRELMEFPVLFLGALPKKTPALYSLMNYAAIRGGTWYPNGGMYRIVDAMYTLAVELGVKFHFNHNVTEIVVEKSIAKKVMVTDSSLLTTTTKCFESDVIIGGADYHHIETKLLSQQYRTYSAAYWDSRILAPGCIIFYIGLNKKLKNILHHTLFFDTSFETHGQEIYETKQWPSNPLFYVSATSVTDSTVAPEGCENLFFLIPVAAGLTNDSEAVREQYFNMIVSRMEQKIGEPFKENIIYKKSFAQTDFVNEYNAFKGNAYGLANTLFQTAILKPSCKSKKVKNLFYTGQLTVPGPGVPPSLISGEVVSKEVLKAF